VRDRDRDRERCEGVSGLVEYARCTGRICVCCLLTDAAHLLSLSLSVFFENMCIIYEFVFHKVPKQCPDAWLMSSCNSTHTHYPLRACGEQRKETSPPNICFAYLPWPVYVCVCVCIWGSVRSRDPSIHLNCSVSGCVCGNTSRCDPDKPCRRRVIVKHRSRPLVCVR